jgi:hypothetical protein
MTDGQITDADRKLAAQCLACPVCRRARTNQKGLFFWFVKRLEGRICPACKAYKKVYGQKAHEPIPTGGLQESPAKD